MCVCVCVCVCVFTYIISMFKDCITETDIQTERHSTL